jgi:hypothetical protein
MCKLYLTFQYNQTMRSDTQDLPALTGLVKTENLPGHATQFAGQAGSKTNPPKWINLLAGRSKVGRFWTPLVILLLLLLPACAPILNASQPYYFVTAESAPTLTPFQPGEASPAPTWPIPLSATPNPTAVPTLTATHAPPTSTVMPASPAEAPDTSHLTPDTITYNINALWDYAGRSLTVAQEITYPNRSGETLSTILLAVNPNLWRGTFALTSLTVNDQPVNNHSLSGQTLTLPLPAPLASGESLRIGLKYNLALPYSSGTYQNFGYTARQTNLIDWFPFIPPYFPGQGWILSEPWTYGENFAYPLADFYIGVTFADANPPTVAASAPIFEQGNTLRYVHKGARTFTLSASYDFQVSSSEENGITVTSYYFPEHYNGGQRILQETQAAIRTYQRAFGPYPHTSLAIVETDLNDGLESDGLYFLASSFYAKYDGTAANDLVMIGIHEVAHQWWFGGVSNDQALEPWLDEALCTYAEHIFYEENYPSLLNWWYNVRIRYYDPSGYADTRIYNTGSFRAYVNAVYLRGALFLDALRSRIGDEAFFTFLRDYYARHRGRIATADTFFAVLADHTANADDLIRTYFYYR